MLTKSQASLCILILFLSCSLILNLMFCKLKLYIANRAFGGLRKFSAIYKHRQIVDLALKMNKLKTKYNTLA